MIHPVDNHSAWYTFKKCWTEWTELLGKVFYIWQARNEPDYTVLEHTACYRFYALIQWVAEIAPTRVSSFPPTDTRGGWSPSGRDFKHRIGRGKEIFTFAAVSDSHSVRRSLITLISMLIWEYDCFLLRLMQCANSSFFLFINFLVSLHEYAIDKAKCWILMPNLTCRIFINLRIDTWSRFKYTSIKCLRLIYDNDLNWTMFTLYRFHFITNN